MLFETLSTNWRKAKSTSATDSAFPSRIPTTTEPTNDGVHVLASGDGGRAQNKLVVVPYGVGSDNHTFDLRILGWRSVGQRNNRLWVPVMIAELAVTLSAAVGIAGAPVVATERFADTLVITTGNADYVDILSPTNDLIAHAIVNLLGFQKIEFTFDLGAGTDCNALFALL